MGHKSIEREWEQEHKFPPPAPAKQLALLIAGLDGVIGMVASRTENGITFRPLRLKPVVSVQFSRPRRSLQQPPPKYCVHCGKAHRDDRKVPRRLFLDPAIESRCRLFDTETLAGQRRARCSRSFNTLASPQLHTLTRFIMQLPGKLFLHATRPRNTTTFDFLGLYDKIRPILSAHGWQIITLNPFGSSKQHKHKRLLSSGGHYNFLLLCYKDTCVTFWSCLPTTVPAGLSWSLSL